VPDVAVHLRLVRCLLLPLHLHEVIIACCTGCHMFARTLLQGSWSARHYFAAPSQRVYQDEADANALHVLPTRTNGCSDLLDTAAERDGGGKRSPSRSRSPPRARSKSPKSRGPASIALKPQQAWTQRAADAAVKHAHAATYDATREPSGSATASGPVDTNVAAQLECYIRAAASVSTNEAPVSVLENHPWLPRPRPRSAGASRRHFSAHAYYLLQLGCT
jgi:hypothetical protein